MRQRLLTALRGLAWRMSCYRGLIHELERAEHAARTEKAIRRTRPGR